MIGYNKIINELVDADGKKIGGDDGAISSDDAISASDYTTDDFVRTSRQGMSRFLYRGFFGEDDEVEDGEEELELPPGDESRFKKKKSKDLEEAANYKMKNVIEDIFTKKKFDDDMVKSYRDNQIRMNGIPPLDTIRDTNPILIRKVSVLKDIIDKNDATGEEKAVIINHLLDMNLADIPREYKEELKKKLA
jgi:hypothetical protein